VSED